MRDTAKVGGKVGDFLIVRVKRNREHYQAYLCTLCSKGWWFKVPMEALKMKHLLQHSASHVTDPEAAAAKVAGPISRDMLLPFSTKRRKKRKVAERSKERQAA